MNTELVLVLADLVKELREISGCLETLTVEMQDLNFNLDINVKYIVEAEDAGD